MTCPPPPTAILTPASGTGHGLTLTLTQTDPDAGRPSIQMVQPTVDVSLSPHPTEHPVSPAGHSAEHRRSTRRPAPLQARSLSLARVRVAPPGRRVVLPAGWSDASRQVDRNAHAAPDRPLHASRSRAWGRPPSPSTGHGGVRPPQPRPRAVVASPCPSPPAIPTGWTCPGSPSTRPRPPARPRWPPAGFTLGLAVRR